MATGALPQFGGAAWFTVTFTGQTTAGFHPKVVLAGDAGVVFDVYDSCAGTSIATATTSWNTTSVTIGTIYVKVYRQAGVPTCNPFTLAISNG
jgi:hypothetical protein